MPNTGRSSKGKDPAQQLNPATRTQKLFPAGGQVSKLTGYSPSICLPNGAKRFIIRSQIGTPEKDLGLYSDPWLREARDKIRPLPENGLGIPHQNPPEIDRLAEAIEKAVKAALIESHGSIPQKYDNQKLVLLCQSTGVWEVLPPALKSLVQEVESYRLIDNPGTELPAPERLQKYLSAARRLIDYIEYHVIGNDSVLRRLSVD